MRFDRVSASVDRSIETIKGSSSHFRVFTNSHMTLISHVIGLRHLKLTKIITVDTSQHHSQTPSQTNLLNNHYRPAYTATMTDSEQGEPTSLLTTPPTP
jgi:hypothetical protein